MTRLRCHPFGPHYYRLAMRGCGRVQSPSTWGAAVPAGTAKQINGWSLTSWQHRLWEAALLIKHTRCCGCR
jgi:hypothetical protein